MTSAWLELLLQRKEFHHSIVFVVEEILPSYQNWRFNNPIEKETFGQKVLKVCSMHIVYRPLFLKSLRFDEKNSA